VQELGERRLRGGPIGVDVKTLHLSRFLLKNYRISSAGGECPMYLLPKANSVQEEKTFIVPLPGQENRRSHEFILSLSV